MVSRGRHPKSAVASVLRKARQAGFEVVEDHNGHRWGYIIYPECAAPQKIWSTPRSPDRHAQFLNSFLDEHMQVGCRDR